MEQVRVHTDMARPIQKGQEMRISIAGGIVTLAIVCGLLFAVGGNESGGGAGDMEVTTRPAVLISPAVKIGELSVYGVKLGDSVDRIPNNAAVSAQDVPERPQDVVYAGRDVRFYAFQKRIYRIRIQGDLAKQIPTYDSDRLQVAFGKADEVSEASSGKDTYVSFFSRHLRYTVHRRRTLSFVTEVDLYAP